MRKLSLVGLALMALGVAPSLAPAPARACGGFFCNAQSQTPIIQAGERVLFARHDGLMTMHIEIVYQGDPTLFGWILPLAELPMDATGQPLPLDKAVEVSSQRLFPLLQQRTDPSFVLVRDPNDTTLCPMPSVADTTGTAADAATSGDGTPNSSPPVVVLEEAKVGPYDAQLIQADRSDALYEWLGKNGYIQDPAAQPILDHYIQKGFKFLGIRLQSGKDVGDLRPLAITLGEAAPCVPLVLTQIAATPDMPLLVWVLGQGRAVPKNFIHAVIDERAFAFPGAPTYQSQLSQAIDRAGRRAFVTEFAGPSAPFRGMLLPVGTTTARLERSRTLRDALQTLGALGIAPGDPDLDVVLRERVPMPAGLKGFPGGNCYYCESCTWAEEQCAASGQPNASHETSEAEFYGYLDYWASRDDAGEIDLGVDVPALVQALKDELFTPRERIEELFARTSTLTRFFTLIDPSEMTRDPIFSFNPELPAVSNVHTATYDLIDCDSNLAKVTYADGTTVRTSCGGSCSFGFPSIAPTVEETLLHPEVLDEEGQPIPFAPEQAAEVDRLLDSALPGFPSLPPTFEPMTPPRPPLAEGASPVGDDGGCAGAGPSALAALLFVTWSFRGGLRRARSAARR